MWHHMHVRTLLLSLSLVTAEHAFHGRLLLLLLLMLRCRMHAPMGGVVVAGLMHLIQMVLVVCCLCANPPVTTWSGVARGPRGGRVPQLWFPVWPKIRSGGKGKFSAGWLSAEAGCWSLSRKASRHRY